MSSPSAASSAQPDPFFLSDADLRDLTPEQLDRYRSALKALRSVDTVDGWKARARREQLAPPAFYLWILCGGRGAGKTTSAAHWLAEQLLGDGYGDESAIVAPTFGDARDVCVEGPTGLLAALGTNRQEVDAGESRHVRTWNRSIGEVVMRNGARVQIDGADDGALRLQGHNFSRAWCEEIGNWRVGAGEQAWDESLLLAVRMGTPQIVVTGTPRPTPLMKRLLKDPAAVVTRMTTFDNAANLPDSWLEQMVSRNEGTRRGEAQLYGRMVEDVEGALWDSENIELNRVEGLPALPLRGTAVGLDPSDGSATGAEQGLAVVSAALDGFLYVQRSEGLRVSPLAFMRHAIHVARQYEGSRIVLEKNFGGKAILEVLDQAQREAGTSIPVKVITATQGKTTRAEPIAALSEQNRVKFVGRHPELEDQLTSFTGAPREKSPDRLDAFVHAAQDLIGYARHPRSGDQDIGRVVPYTDGPLPEGVYAWDDGPGELPGTWGFATSPDRERFEMGGEW